MCECEAYRTIAVELVARMASDATLHLTNGDAALYLLNKAGIPGTHLAWQDALDHGPVPAGLTLEETSAVRGRYLAEHGYGSPIKIIHDFERRDAQIRRARDFQEIVLWFEHDLFDQLQLLQILTALEELDLEAGAVSIVQTDHYLAGMTVDEMAPLLRKRRPVTAAIYKSARRSWDRFTSGSPHELLIGAGEDAIGLPFLRPALRRLCEEYPWKRDGLSRSQRQALEAVARGPAPVDELLTRAAAREEAAFLGKRGFEHILRELSDEEAALIEGPENECVPSALGRRILAGEADWLEEHAIDRWVGGAHLQPERCPRWDDQAARFV